VSPPFFQGLEFEQLRAGQFEIRPGFDENMVFF